VSQSGPQYPTPFVAEPSRRACQAVSVAAGSYAIVAGAITLAGWAFDIQRLTDWRNDNISMFANTAICVLLCGIALLCLVVRWDRAIRFTVARMLAGAVAVVAALTIFELVTSVNLGIDTLLFNRPWGQRASTAPMRMGPPASMSFFILSVALILSTYGVPARRIASGMATSVVAIASLSLIGYWFGADKLFGIARITGIAWQTSTILWALGIGLMTSMPDRGIMLALGRDDAGGTVLRRLIVPIIGIPLLLGWLRVMGQQMNLYDMAFGTAVRTLAEIVLLIMLLWWTATGISIHSQAARQAELALRESEQRYRVIAAAAKNADRRKDEFLATLAHELRNPLAPIGNALALIQHAADDQHIQQQAHETIQRQFGQMVRLVDDLLDVSRITRDKLELRTQRVELPSVIHQAVETCQSLAEGMGHELQVNLPSEQIWVHADPVRLAQIFINLLNNACKFTEAGGVISITVERQAGDAVISVKDTGIGIAPDKIDSIFEMFQQVDQSLERIRGGLGIGLTIVKRLVELHGGRISVQSNGPGRGSEFIVRLPVLVESAGSAPLASKASAVAATPRRILVTDDNRDAAKSLALLLQYNGHEVETAHDGRQAIAKAEVWRPDVMLLDLGMPEMNGYDVCRSIRQTAWGKGIRIVALTGWGQDQDRRNTREAGFDAHLVKPVDLLALRDALA
jgi:signal transduction histidine kinase